MKKSILTSLLLLPFATATFADSFYVGVQAGADFASTEKESSSIFIKDSTGLPDPNFAALAAKLDRVSGTGASGTLFAGYFWRFNTIGLGIEGQVNADTSKSNQSIRNAEYDSGLNFASEEKIKGYYGAAIKPAVFITDTAKLYAKLGWVSGRYSIKATDAGGVLGASRTFSKSLSGGQIGAGLEIFVNPKLAFTAEFNHVHYEKIKNVPSQSPGLNAQAERDSGGDPEEKATEIGLATYRPQSNHVLVGMTYYFNKQEEGFDVVDENYTDFDV